MAKPKMAAATSVQLGIEKGLRIAVFILAAMHTLLSLFRYAVDISAFQSVERWFALVLLTASVTYLFVTKIRYPNTFYRIRSFFSAMKSYEQLFLIAMFLWLVLVCWIWQLTSNYSFLKAFDW